MNSSLFFFSILHFAGRHFSQRRATLIKAQDEDEIEADDEVEFATSRA
jgi:hypothetical protein